MNLGIETVGLVLLDIHVEPFVKVVAWAAADSSVQDFDFVEVQH